MVERGISTVHFVVWNFLLSDMTSLALEGVPFSQDNVLSHAKRRIKVRLASAEQRVQEAKRRADSRGDAKPQLDHVRAWLAGIGEIDEDGNIVYSQEFKQWME